MANTTELNWSVDGQSLQTYAFNIENWGSGRQGVPTFRGEDYTIPYRDGRIFVPKTVESRSITLAMWVIGADENGNAPTDRTGRQLFEDNWRRLRALLWGSPRRLLMIQKTIRIRRANGSYVDVPVTGRGYFQGGLDPIMTGGNRATFQVDIFMPDPWFYANVPLNRQFTARNQEWVPDADLQGDAVTNRVDFAFEGSWAIPTMTSPTVYDQASNSYLSLQYNAVLNTSSTGSRLQLQSADQIAFDQANSRYVSGRVSHTGARDWYEFTPRIGQSIRFSATNGSGSAEASITPRYF